MNVSRRDFARATAAAALLRSSSRAAQDAPANGAAPPSKKVRYAVVGLGRISLKHFMPGCKTSQYSQIAGLVSGERDKAEKNASEYNVPSQNLYSYKNFDDIRTNKDIDAVYIALPNSMHAEYTIRAANAGKHVFCEKPMAATVKESQAMIDACKAANVKLMIAYRCQFEPTNLKAIQLIRDGKLGTVQAIESANGFNIQAGEWRLNRKLAGGGPLMDVGIYSLNACRHLVGEEPTKIAAYASTSATDDRFKQVEETCGWTMRFPSGVIASCTTTYGADMPGFYRVHGSKGVLHMEPAFSYEGIHMKTEVKGEEPIDETEEAKDPNQFLVEADEFSRCVLDNRNPTADGMEGLRDMKYMEEIYKSAGLRMG